MSTSEIHRGSCLCGGVRFEVDGRFEAFFLCHCSYCRKDSGSAHGANLFSPTAKLRWLAGESSVKTFNLPSTRHTKCFCSECGSALPHVESGEWLLVPAGSLDTPVSIRPTAHIYMSSKADWDNDLEYVRKLDGLPT